MRQLTPPIEDFLIDEAPFYLPVGQEIDLFTHAWRARIPVILKGPTGCGKTRFVSHMAHRLGRPLVTVACHEDLTASDLVGRYLIQGDETLWVDGPMTAAIRHGAILYLDEIVEARKDTMVVIHPLTDHRRILTIDKLASVLRAPDDFMLVVSYNPGYQSVLKEMKQSTRQRFIALDFTYPPPETERDVVVKEAGLDRDTAFSLVKIAEKVRNLTSRGLDEGVSTRLLIHAARLIAEGSSPTDACDAAFARTLTDDPDMQRSIQQVVADYF
ncbi:MAG: CbbQ/NirQ/NorQ/GpvN family protein [Myxococcota bacterium]